MDLIEVADRIYNNCKLLAEEVQKLPSLCEQSAQAQAAYDRELGVAIATLKAEGEPVSIIDKLARGKCHHFLLDKLVAEGKVKACNANINAIESRISAYQSINKHLANMNVEDL